MLMLASVYIGKKQLSYLMIIIACCFSALSVAETIHIDVAKGFGVTLFASGLGDAKQLAVGDNGTIFVASKRKASVQALLDTNSDGLVDQRFVIVRKLKFIPAITYHQGDLYVAVNRQILKYSNIEQNMVRPSRPEVVFDELPPQSRKYERAIKFGADGRLYVSLSANCSSCMSRQPNGTILAINLSNSEVEVIASGIRYVTGFDWSPATNTLWFADRGRNRLGYDIAVDELNRVDAVGQHYGFPFLHGANLADQEFKQPEGLQVVVPEYELPAHVTPSGLHFYQGTMFPNKYQQQLFIAENGSTNRSSKVGYQVVLLEMQQQQIVKRTPIVRFLEERYPVARPHSIVTGKDGALYISDDLKGNVYRLYYKPPQTAQAQE